MVEALEEKTIVAEEGRPEKKGDILTSSDGAEIYKLLWHMKAHSAVYKPLMSMVLDIYIN